MIIWSTISSTKNISSAPFLFPKSISIVPPNTLSLGLILPNALSTEAISGQYGAKNLICWSRSLILFIVFIDECVLALSRMMMGGLVMSLLLLLIVTFNNSKKNQNFSEFTVSKTTIEIHSPIFPSGQYNEAGPSFQLIINNRITPSDRQPRELSLHWAIGAWLVPNW